MLKQLIHSKQASYDNKILVYTTIQPKTNWRLNKTEILTTNNILPIQVTKYCNNISTMSLAHHYHFLFIGHHLEIYGILCVLWSDSLNKLLIIIITTTTITITIIYLAAFQKLKDSWILNIKMHIWQPCPGERFMCAEN